MKSNTVLLSALTTGENLPRVSSVTDIRQEFVRQASKRSVEMDNIEKMRLNQKAWMDEKTGKGKMSDTLFPHDEAVWNRIPDVKNHPINVFLPGYAVGDRYTAILTMLLCPQLNITIAYSKDKPLLPNEKKYAEEAYDIMVDALQKHCYSEEEIAKRVSLAEYEGGGLRDIVESFNAPQNRERFKMIRGEESPIKHEYGDNTHLFHISATTVLMAKCWEDDSDPSKVKDMSGKIREAIYKLIPDKTKAELAKLAERTIANCNVKEGSVMLWITNKPFENPVNDPASARMKEAFANPHMFELVQDMFEKAGTPVVYIADGFRNVYKDRVEDRHPYKDLLTANIGKFWELSPLLGDRVNQWYFIDQIFDKAKLKGLVGVRSGAIEPFGLLGHNVVYLEHREMFTPERHAPWQGRIPYKRLITEKTTGYLNNRTEIEKKQLTKEILSASLAIRSRTEQNSVPGLKELQALSRQATKLQREIEELEQDIQSGVLSSSELTLLKEMIDTRKTAHEIIHSQKISEQKRLLKR